MNIEKADPMWHMYFDTNAAMGFYGHLMLVQQKVGTYIMLLFFLFVFLHTVSEYVRRNQIIDLIVRIRSAKGAK